MTDLPQDKDSQATTDHIPLAEWIVAAIGGLLVIASFVFLAYRSVSELVPPSFEFEIKDFNSIDQQSAVTVSVTNTGGKPVADLRVRATGPESASREVTVDYVPAKSSRKITFVFDPPTEASQLKFTIESFTEP